MTMKEFLKKILRRILSENMFDLVAYLFIFKRMPNIKHPKYFNEKIIYRKHYDKNYMYTLCSDKVAVREYINNQIGQEYLIPSILITSDPKDLLKLNNLDSCVIKLNTGSGLNLIEPNIVTDNDKEELINKLINWMSIEKFGENEGQYQNIEKKIIVEKSLCTNGKVPNDYKFHCFKQKNGSIKYILQLVNGRFLNESRGYYINNLQECVHHHGQGKHHIPKKDIQTLTEICKLNQLLCQHFNYVRIDWYVIEGKAFFGEMTFTPGGGFSSEYGEQLEIEMCKMWVY